MTTRLAVGLIPFPKSLIPKHDESLLPRSLGQLASQMAEVEQVRSDALAQFRRLFGRDPGPDETLKVNLGQGPRDALAPSPGQ